MSEKDQSGGPGGPVRRDTPRDVPAVHAPGAGELSRPRGLETLEALYQEWLALKLEHAAAWARQAEERQKLEQQGSFLVGAVRAASGEAPPGGAAPGDALADRAGLDGFLREAEERLGAARTALEASIAAEEATQVRALEEVRGRIHERVQRFLERVRPRLELVLRPVGTTRAILHLKRVSPDEAVLLLCVFAGKIPSRHDFLFDDSTEDAALTPPPLYPDEGVTELRPGGRALRERLRGPGEVAPIKGFLPVWVPRPGGGEDFFRLLQRGPVMEAEVLEGETFRSVLAREEAERLAGHLLRLKLEGRLELEIQTG